MNQELAKRDVVGVVGAGLMGSGIAQVSALAGHDVVLTDVDESSLERGMAGIEASLGKFVAKGAVDRHDADAAVARIRTTTQLASLRDASIVVEAVYEQLEAKRGIFSKLDSVVRADAILATNTSALPITSIASATDRPEQVVGTHFFSPVPLMQLCELVRGDRTSDATLTTARSFAEGVGKTCIVVNRDIAGFVTTRLIAALSIEAARLVESGVATAADIDTACRLGFGHKMGPLQTLDLTGIDIMVNAADNIAAQDSSGSFAVPELLRQMVASGHLGRKSGEGFYDYREAGQPS
jgi:3-hydroxybutyryl-CoA dehydrogenase